jgi:hypothetical protein
MRRDRVPGRGLGARLVRADQPARCRRSARGRRQLNRSARFGRVSPAEEAAWSLRLANRGRSSVETVASSVGVPPIGGIAVDDRAEVALAVLAAPHRPGTGSARHFGESAVQVFAEELRRLPWNARRDWFERRVRARQQIGDLSLLDATPMRHRRVANVVRSSSEKSCGSSQAAKWPPLLTSLK